MPWGLDFSSPSSPQTSWHFLNSLEVRGNPGGDGAEGGLISAAVRMVASNQIYIVIEKVMKWYTFLHLCAWWLPVCLCQWNYAFLLGILLWQRVWHIVGTQETVGSRMNQYCRARLACQLLHIFDLVSLLDQEKKKKKEEVLPYFCLLHASLSCLLLWFPEFPNNVALPEITLQCFLEHFCRPPYLQWLHFNFLYASCCDSSLSQNLYMHPPQWS